MEPLIEKTDRTIWAEQWRQARVRIDQTALQRNLDSIRRITSDFVQENSATNGFQAWTNLKPFVYFLFHNMLPEIHLILVTRPKTFALSVGVEKYLSLVVNPTMSFSA
jgi:hypothetical protein